MPIYGKKISEWRVGGRGGGGTASRCNADKESVERIDLAEDTDLTLVGPP